MSTKAQAVLEGFRSLPRDEQYAVYETIARSVTPGDYGPLSDDDLTAIAAQTFSLLDTRRSLVPSRGEVWLVDLGMVQELTGQQLALVEAGVRDWLVL